MNYAVSSKPDTQSQVQSESLSQNRHKQILYSNIYIHKHISEIKQKFYRIQLSEIKVIQTCFSLILRFIHIYMEPLEVENY